MLTLLTLIILFGFLNRLGHAAREPRLGIGRKSPFQLS
jgi:hypothetical protein